ncbi:MAG TPA: hypothetical protein VGV88_15035 [Candidatus Dormibacteraeota bacterium]|nr:hypothetical protein [Candidatus Dormibacteraeota bacterium]
MRTALAAVLFVTVLSCGGSSTAGAAPSPAGLLSNPCGYLSKADFQHTLGLPLEGYRAGQLCGYRDARGNTCQVTMITDTGQYAASEAAASRYGVVVALGVGDRSFYSAQRQRVGAWIFDLGLMKGTSFAGTLCGADLGSSDPKPQAERLASLIASRL